MMTESKTNGGISDQSSASKTSIQARRSARPINRAGLFADARRRLATVKTMKKNELLQKDAPKSREEFSSRETVRMLLSSLIPAEESGSETSLPTKQNIDVLRNAISSLHEAAGEAILTDEEADALINLLVNRFVEKEIDRTVRRMLVPKKDRWFVIAAQSHHE